jgi:hypothetical protein
VSALDDWIALVPPPARPVAVDWPAVERRLGTRLPADYRGYVDTYGLGSVGDLFWVLHPYGRPDRLNLADQWAAEPGPLLTPPPYPVGQVPGGLLPCAVDEDAGVLHWHAAGPDPDRWTVVYRDEDGDRWYPFDLGLVAFLHAVFTGGLPGLGYAEAGYLSGPVRFEPLPVSPR